ncbi:hypothetical protein [uncultured Paraglaciecola sp.]|uniref:hypothetical protein n=1 Tax=uncultured Paraglaciecola sp. TaxID=1765024 RepID=UPI0030DA8B78|tara:strand:- start:35117 stop:35623 length:507 start_codon:yes stop_codon:yes gene_type:complete
MRICYIILFIVYSTNALALVKFTPEELKNIAVHFLKAKNRSQQPKPSENDIKIFLDALASDLKVEYIYPEMEPVKSDKDGLHQKVLTQIQNEYEYSKIQVLEYITGYNFIVVKLIEKSKHNGNIYYKASDGERMVAVSDKGIEGELEIIFTLQVNPKGLIEVISQRIG